MGIYLPSNFCLERMCSRTWKEVGFKDPIGTFVLFFILIFVAYKQQKYTPFADQPAYLQPDKLVSVAHKPKYNKSLIFDTGPGRTMCNLEIISCAPLKYKKDHSNFNLSN